MTGTADPAEAAAALRVLLSAVQEGELVSRAAGRHWLAGAIAGLELAARSGVPQAASPASVNAL